MDGGCATLKECRFTYQYQEFVNLQLPSPIKVSGAIFEANSGNIQRYHYHYEINTIFLGIFLEALMS